jgi:DNA replicative helicase MCM subunit Mcm2 (Cdc46/Mcm family)
MMSNALFEQLEYSSIRSLYDITRIGEPVKVRAIINQMGTPLIHNGQLSSYVVIQSPESDQITSTEITSQALIHKLQDMREPTCLIDVYGRLATVESWRFPDKEEFRLVVYDVQPVRTALELICANHQEVEQVEQKLEQLKEQSIDIYEYLRTTVIYQIGIRGINEIPELSDSIDAIILQVASEGWLNNRDSGKIHTLVIGAPATGKKLLVEAIRALNPIYQEARGGKLTVAGICGTAHYDGDKWRSKPGYVPLANGGVFAIQDFHHVKATQRDKALDTLSLVIEDGKVIDSTSARQTHHALTAIHLDTNKRSDLFPEAALGKSLQEDIGIGMHLLSRFDYICDIKRDIQRQKTIVKAMYDGGSTVSTEHPDAVRETWTRELQLMIAYLRSKHPTIDLQPVTAYMRQRHEQLMAMVEEQFESVPALLSDFQTRTVNSVRKMVAAKARLADRNTATKEDVDFAFQLLSRKFEFVSALMASYTAFFGNAKMRGELLRGNQVREWLLQTFAGEQVTRAEILEQMQQLPSPPSARTIERHLEAMGFRVEHGYYQFPDLYERNSSSMQIFKRPQGLDNG